MKKFGVIIAIIAIVALAGCAGGGGGGGGGGAAPFIVELSELNVRNANAFSKAWDDHFIDLPASALPSNFNDYSRLTITCKYFTAGGDEIPQADSNVMVTMVYNKDGDWRGPSMGPGPNTPVKEFNVGGFSGMIHKDRGIRVTFREAPSGVLFQNNSGSAVAFVELTSLVFHNGNYEAE